MRRLYPEPDTRPPIDGQMTAGCQQPDGLNLKQKEKEKEKEKAVTSPSLDEVKLQASKIGLPVSESERFFNYYESNGWHVGKNKMRSWSAALNNWKLNTLKYDTKHTNSRPTTPDRNSGTYNDKPLTDAAKSKIR